MPYTELKIQLGNQTRPQPSCCLQSGVDDSKPKRNVWSFLCAVLKDGIDSIFLKWQKRKYLPDSQIQIFSEVNYVVDTVPLQRLSDELIFVSLSSSTRMAFILN